MVCVFLFLVIDVSLLIKVDRLDCVKCEVDMDGFLYNLVFVMDMVINKCKLGFLGGLLVVVV